MVFIREIMDISDCMRGTILRSQKHWSGKCNSKFEKLFIMDNKRTNCVANIFAIIISTIYKIQQTGN